MIALSRCHPFVVILSEARDLLLRSDKSRSFAALRMTILRMTRAHCDTGFDMIRGIVSK
jgi:hypothetical protein